MKVLVAPLNWGIGHATRSVPVIHSFLEKGYQVEIASSGMSLVFLRKKFPNLEMFELPDYQIKYHKGLPVWLSVLLQGVRIVNAIYSERKVFKSIISQSNYDLIVSDNRYGIYSNKVKSVLICHQLNPISPYKLFQNKVEYVHRFLCRHFNEIWIPDYQNNKDKLSGQLTDLSLEWKNTIRFINPLSQLQVNQNKFQVKGRVLILLSGIEPYRSLLEDKLINLLGQNHQQCVFVGGTYTHENKTRITYYSFLNKENLELELNKAEIIICRSGYSTIMDVHNLVNKQIILIPTPGQTEQEYLAQYLSKRHGNIYSLAEDNLSCLLSLIENISNNS